MLLATNTFLFCLIYKLDLESCYQGEFKPGLGSDPAAVKEKLDA